jgi:hypothetical protein
MAAKKLEAERRVQEELDRQKKELDEWLDFCDETETTGLVCMPPCFYGCYSTCLEIHNMVQVPSRVPSHDCGDDV